MSCSVNSNIASKGTTGTLKIKRAQVLASHANISTVDHNGLKIDDPSPNSRPYSSAA